MSCSDCNSFCRCRYLHFSLFLPIWTQRSSSFSHRNWEKMCFALSLRAAFLFDERTLLLRKGQHLPCQSDKRHRFPEPAGSQPHRTSPGHPSSTSGCLEQPHNLEELKQRAHASRSCTYHTLYFNPVPQALFPVSAARRTCELTPIFPACARC